VKFSVCFYFILFFAHFLVFFHVQLATRFKNSYFARKKTKLRRVGVEPGNTDDETVYLPNHNFIIR